MVDPASDRQLANAVRVLVADAVVASAVEHRAFPLAMADAASVLFSRVLTLDPKQPRWPNRDRILVAAEGGEPLLIALLYLLGFDGVDLADVENSAAPGSRPPGLSACGGAEMTASGLKEGVAVAVGLASAERRLGGEFGSELIDHRTYCLVDAACLEEPVNRHAIAAAGELELSKLVLVQAVGPARAGEEAEADGLGGLCEKTGWQVLHCDVATIEGVAEAFAEAGRGSRPTLVRVRGDLACDGRLAGSELAEMRARLGWDEGPFKLPSEIKDRWRVAGLRAASRRKEWLKSREVGEATAEGEFDRRMRGDLPTALPERVIGLKRDFVESAPEGSLIDASQRVLRELVPLMPEIFGIRLSEPGGDTDEGSGIGEASLTEWSESDPADALAAGLWRDGETGLASGFGLHGGLVPCGEIAWPPNDDAVGSIKLARRLGVCLVFVALIEDFGLRGEAARAWDRKLDPGLMILRPADPSEVAECWELALAAADEPVVLMLSSLQAPALRLELSRENECARGAYEISSANGAAEVTLFAGGPDVHLALAVAERVRAARHRCRVVSMPCVPLFRAESAEYRATFLDRDDLAVGLGRTGEEAMDVLGEAAMLLGAGDIAPAEPDEAPLATVERVAPDLAARILARLARAPGAD